MKFNELFTNYSYTKPLEGSFSGTIKSLTLDVAKTGAKSAVFVLEIPSENRTIEVRQTLKLESQMNYFMGQITNICTQLGLNSSTGMDETIESILNKEVNFDLTYNGNYSVHFDYFVETVDTDNVEFPTL